MTAIRLFVALFTVSLLMGCEDSSTQTSHVPSGSSSKSSGGPPPPPAGATAVEPYVEPPQSVESTTQEVEISNSAEPSEEIEYESEVVSVGADKRGRNYGGGIVSEPIKQYFGLRQRINLLKLESAMNQYRAINDKNPASQDAFMKDIVEANGIELPQLPDGEKYRYDPSTGQLMVDRPKS